MNAYRDSHCLLTQRLSAYFGSGNVGTRTQSHVQNGGIQLHAGDNSIALALTRIREASKGANGDEECALGPSTVEDEGASTKHVEKYHGEQGGDD